MITSAQTMVLGGGTAGAAVAGLLAEHTDQTVLLVEAGPDYGAQENWPQDLLSAARMPIGSHDWGYTETTSYPGRTMGPGPGGVFGHQWLWGHLGASLRLRWLGCRG